jgi:hypothetical protein
MKDFDTANRFMVGAQAHGKAVRIVLNKLSTILTRDQALNLAAWLVAVADPTQKDFPGMLEEVLNS